MQARDMDLSPFYSLHIQSIEVSLYSTTATTYSRFASNPVACSDITVIENGDTVRKRASVADQQQWLRRFGLIFEHFSQKTNF